MTAKQTAKIPVLVAAGDPLFIGALTDALKRAGFQVLTADDGAEAVELYLKKKPEIIVASFALEQVSGYDFFARVRKSERGGNLPLVALSEPLPPAEEDQLINLYQLAAIFYQPLNPALVADKVRQLAAGLKPAPARKKPAKSIDLRGDLSQMPFYKLLLFFHTRRVSGRLLLRGAETVLLDIVSGRPYRIEDYHIGLGEALFEKGLLTEEEITFYRAQTAEFGEDAVEWLVRMGALSIDALRLERERFQIRKLVEIFGWPGGEYDFHGAEPTFIPPQLASINFPELIHRGLFETASQQMLGDFLLARQAQYLAPSDSFFDLLYFLKLEPFEIDLLDRLDGRLMLRDLMSAGRGKWEPEQALRTLFSFDALGMLEGFEAPPEKLPAPAFPMRKRPPVEDVGYVKMDIEELERLVAERQAEEALPEAVEAGAEEAQDFFSDIGAELDGLAEEINLPAAPVSLAELGVEVPAADPAQLALENELREFHQAMKDKDYYQLLGTTYQKYEFSTIKENYHRLVRRFSPQNFMASSGEIMALAEEVLAQIAAAYNVLSNVVSKEQYDAELTRTLKAPGGVSNTAVQVEVHFNSGLAFLDMGDYAAAEKAFRQVLDLSPENTEAEVHLAWAVYAAPAHRQSRTFREQALNVFKKARRLKPEMPELYAYTGMVLLDDEKYTLAEVELKKALARRPKYRLALEGLKAIERLKEGGKKGLFGKLVS